MRSTSLRKLNLAIKIINFSVPTVIGRKDMIMEKSRRDKDGKEERQGKGEMA